MHSKRCGVGLGWVGGIGALGALGGQAMVSSWAWPVLLVALGVLNTLVVWPALRARTRFALSAWLLLALFSAAADPIGIAFANHFAPHPAWRLLCSVLIAAFVALWYLPAVAIVMAAAARFSSRFSPRASRLMMPLLLGLAIALAEYLRVTFGPVPMALLAYGLTDTPLLHAAPWVGACGAGALAVAGTGWLALALRSRRAPVFAAAVVVASVGSVMSMPPGPTLRTHSPPATEALRVTVAMPPSMPLGHIEIAALKVRAEAMLAAVAQAEGDLVVFAETALPMPWGALPGSVRDAFQRVATERGSTIVMGAFRQQQAQGFNTAVIVSPARTQARFIDKHALFPLTEYLPNGMGWVRSAMGMAARDLSAGPAQAEPLSVGDRRLGLVICYEIGVPSLFAQRAADAQAMLLLSDMSWFDRPAAAAHLHAMARWRAAETRRWLLSVSTPYGAMLIDPAGAMVASSSLPTLSWQVDMPVSSR